MAGWGQRAARLTVMGGGEETSAGHVQHQETHKIFAGCEMCCSLGAGAVRSLLGVELSACVSFFSEPLGLRTEPTWEDLLCVQHKAWCPAPAWELCPFLCAGYFLQHFASCIAMLSLLGRIPREEMNSLWSLVLLGPGSTCRGFRPSSALLCSAVGRHVASPVWGAERAHESDSSVIHGPFHLRVIPFGPGGCRKGRTLKGLKSAEGREKLI